VHRIGVDVGGTFTDIFMVGDEGISVHKVPSTPADPSIATVHGMAEACAKRSLGLADLDLVFHGTTVATNTILQRSGAVVGMITTEGFRDILHIARHKKPFNFSLQQTLPWQEEPIVERSLRLTARERVTAPEGDVLTPLEESDVRAAVERFKEEGVEAIAVCFLHSYLNPEHEQRVAAILEEELPGTFVSLRHVVCPEYREYEAFNTVALNAYLAPVTGRYLGRLTKRLEEADRSGAVLFMTSTGGVESSESVATKPVNMVLSGPVAGVVGGAAAAAASGLDDLITLDVGGTSADIAVVSGGALRHKHWLDNNIGGLQLRLSMVDVSTIGAGGGSIAYVDRGGMLQVGPRSAGAAPGPACYGRDGEEATVTDAQLVLGRLDQTSFLGGRMEISRALARDAIESRVAGALGLSVEETAAGIVRVATAHMVDAIELSTVRRGHDPRDFTLVGFGGAGALFAAEIAAELGIPRVLVPRFPGVAAAMGLLSSDVVHHHSQSVVAELSATEPEALESAYSELESRAHAQLERDGFSGDEAVIERYADCCYVGQGYELRLEAPAGPIDSAWGERLTGLFHDAHEREYGNAFRERDLVIVNVAVRGVGRLPRHDPPPLGPADGPPEPVSRREVWFAGAGGFALCDVYARDSLAAGHSLDGPAIVEQEDSTTVVPPGTTADVDAPGNLILSVPAGSEA
jgi:N-methylhydantoinase A/oxoprolinase/acetone carboxylase beta subunit